MTYRVGTRGSTLALRQTTLVCDRLQAAYPDDAFVPVVISTRGDRVTDRPLSELGGNGVFTSEIERALRAHEIDFAVHSMKDLPAVLSEGLCLSRAWPREDPRDVLVARAAPSFDALPQGAVVATGSVRRSLFVRRRRPDLTLVNIRGNVDTRLRKLFAPEGDEPRLDAVILAAAGLVRLGRTDVITEYLDPMWMIPAPNQGQLALELRAEDAALKARLDALGDPDAERAAVAERAFLRRTGATCRDAVAAWAHVVDGNLQLESFYEPVR